MALDNGVDGFDVYLLDKGQHVRNLSTGKATCHLPKQVCFTEIGGVIVGGSDHGSVYVWDSKTGDLLESLKHVDQGPVRTVTVSLTCFLIVVLLADENRLTKMMASAL
jgi:WD40 repeat protein